MERTIFLCPVCHFELFRENEDSESIFPCYCCKQPLLLDRSTTPPRIVPVQPTMLPSEVRLGGDRNELPGDLPQPETDLSFPFIPVSMKYILEDQVGTGSTGTVYRGYDRCLERTVAIKRLTTDSRESRRNVAQFLNEAKAIARLANQYIVTVYEIAQDDRGYYIVMEYIEGISLDRFLDRSPRPGLQVIVTLFDKIAQGVKHAHDRGVIHRNLKPSNIMITRDVEPRIVDFGLAFVKGRGIGKDSTATPYNAPEQAFPASEYDRRADIYALGRILCQMLSFTPPTDPPILTGVPGVFHQVIAAATATAPNDRPKDVGMLLETLRRAWFVYQTATKGKKGRKPILCRHCGLSQAATDDGLCPTCNALVSKEDDPDDLVVDFGGEQIFVPPPPGSKQTTEYHLPTMNGSQAKIVQNRTEGGGILEGKHTARWCATCQLLQSVDNTNCSMCHTAVMLLRFSNEFIEEFHRCPPGYCYVPGGWFLMGSNILENARPLHQVYVSSFYISTFPVTNGEYRTFRSTTCYPLGGRGLILEDPRRQNFPVVSVSFADCHQYCVWKRVLLPTEAQWEKAARGYDKRIYPWGGLKIDQTMANFNDYYAGVIRVGALGPNRSPFGVRDMVGNVWEWVRDSYDPSFYQRSTATDPYNQQVDKPHVLRGGGWGSIPEQCRVDYRLPGTMKTRWDLGFRTVIELD